MSIYDYVCEFPQDTQDAIIKEAEKNIDFDFLGVDKTEEIEKILNSKLCDLTDTLENIHKYL